MKQPLILAVDDSEDLRDLYQMVLEQAGYQVVVAADGREALALARKLRPDLIITDVSMPEMNGIELLERLRSDLAPPLPPVIVCSGFNISQDDVMQRGATRFISKPFDPPTLTGLVALTLQGVTAGIDLLAADRRRLDEARARATAAAQRLLRGNHVTDPVVGERMTRLCNWLAGYFACGGASASLVFDGNLHVIAASDSSLAQAGAVFDGERLYSAGVLAAGASLIMSDTRAWPLGAALGVRFLVAVPLVFEGVAIGALCLLDHATHRFAAEDLLILEHLGRGVSSRVRQILTADLEAERARFVLFTPAVFERILGAELALLHREHGSLDLALFELDEEARAQEICDALQRSLAQSRFLVCRLACHRIAVFRRDRDSAAASGTVLRASDQIRRLASLRAVGWLSLIDDGLPAITAEEALRLAHGALEQARASQPGTLTRVALRREPSLTSPGDER